MAARKTTKPADKAAAEGKAEEMVQEIKAAPEKEAAPKKVPAKKETSVKKETSKKETAKKAAVKEEAAEKEPAKTTPARKSAKKAECTTALHIQFAGKSYAREDLEKMAKDVWVFDLNQKAEDLTSLELYVKPEENVVYYVMNKEFNGSFYI